MTTQKPTIDLADLRAKAEAVLLVVPDLAHVKRFVDSPNVDQHPSWMRLAQALADIEAEAIADRKHLEEGARLLWLETAPDAPDWPYAPVEDSTKQYADICAWLDAERARKAPK